MIRESDESMNSRYSRTKKLYVSFVECSDHSTSVEGVVIFFCIPQKSDAESKVAGILLEVDPTNRLSKY